MGLEDTQMVVEAMAQSGGEPTFCMGDDTPLPVLADKPHVLYNYFKQRFAQACTCMHALHAAAVPADCVRVSPGLRLTCGLFLGLLGMFEGLGLHACHCARPDFDEYHAVSGGVWHAPLLRAAFLPGTAARC
jgi:hypothetical protein